MAKIERQHQQELDPAVRRENSAEVACGFTEAQARTEASRCLGCKHKPCVNLCPVGVDIPRFIDALQKEGAAAALGVIKETNALAGVCGRVCPQESQCESVCIRAKMEGAVSIGTLERYAADHGEAGLPKAEKAAAIPLKAAVIGSGPAGLTCAADLAKAGAKVTVFEAFHKAGGVLVYGIPEFRLPKKLVQKEIDTLTAMGVDIRLNTVAGRTVRMDELLEEYDAVFIGTGAGLPQFMNIPGESLPGVFSANEYLTRANLMNALSEHSETPLYRGKNVAVLGAGNVAMDAARTAVRAGAETVTVVYRRSRTEMPARQEEVRHAEEEGVRFELLTAPVRVLGKDKAEGLECIRMQLGEPDEKGRRRPVPVPDSHFTFPCDMVIVSIGTAPNPLLKSTYPSLAVSKWGTLEVDAHMRTSVPRVYAGGDAVTGAATVIMAMGAGREAAATILQDFREGKLKG